MPEFRKTESGGLEVLHETATGWTWTGVPREAADEIERLRNHLRRIDAINDNPARFSSEINAEVEKALRTS